MQTECITRRKDLVIVRHVLEPGEAGPWHTDPCERFTVVLSGEKVRIEFRDGSDNVDVLVHAGMADWEPPEPSAHRVVNVGRARFEEVVTFYLDTPGTDHQPACE